MESMIVPCRGDLRELRGDHHHKDVQITNHAGKSLLDEYRVDEPTCSTPRRRSINLPTIASIEELRSPAFGDLVKSFWDSKSGKHANGDIKHLGQHKGAQPMRDSRLPLTAIN